MNRLATLVPALGLVLAAGCGGNEESAIHASGHIEATQVYLAAQVGGRLLDAPFQEGDRAAVGQLAARLDSSNAQHELARAQAQVDAADAQLRLLLSGTRAEDLQRAEDELAQARAEMENAERDLKRLEGLAERGTATEKARDDASTRHTVAAKKVAAAKAELAKLVAGPRRQEIERARAERSAAEAQVAAAQQRITDATVVVPTAGVITVRVSEPGDVLPPGATFAVLTDIDNPWLTVYVDEPNLSRITLGEKVEVRVDGQPHPFEGHVSYISSVAEFTPKNVQTPEERAKLVFKIKVALENSSGVFKPGMPADAYFPLPTGSGSSDG